MARESKLLLSLVLALVLIGVFMEDWDERDDALLKTELVIFHETKRSDGLSRIVCFS